ncbi:MAG: hypothetical protein AVDCRST_MAG56-690 [uncultured Cytophagales bacterium]|uniref:Uncharacterized protein n=1 Tax=uncultured Cytophagales bacterium TaxID=158755 RepID=A0A6J4HB70_9SPHI|nr:MAG: hypothetical protein AVDCRST_MAG56-690 [uncultured Cytophagales bacterium]
MAAGGVPGGEYVPERSGRTVVEVGSRLPQVAQGGHVNAQQGPTRTLAAGGFEGAHVVHQARGRVGKACPRVAGAAAQVLEEDLAGCSAGRERAVAVAEGAGVERVERLQVGGQGVQVGRGAGLGVSQGVGPRAGVEGRVAHQARTAEVAADVVFKVLHLVEVGRPVDASLARAGPSPQGNGVADAFPAVGEVPVAAVFASVQVARGAADVAVLADARVGCFVEQLLALEHGGRELLGGDNGDGGGAAQRGGALREHTRSVVHGHRAAHEVFGKHAVGGGVNGDALGCLAHIHAGDLLAVGGIEHQEAVVALLGEEDVVALRTESDRRGLGVVVNVLAAGGDLRTGGYVDGGGQEADGGLEGGRSAVPCQSAQDVVLLGHVPGLGAVGAHRQAGYVVGNAPSGHFGIGGGVVNGQVDGGAGREGAQVDLVDRAAAVAGDEARNEQLGGVAGNRKGGGRRPDGKRTGDRTTAGTHAGDPARAVLGNVAGGTVRREDDACRLGTPSQRKRADQRPGAFVEDVHLVFLPTGDPHLGTAVHGYTRRPLAHGHVVDDGEVVGVDGRHVVVVGVDHPHFSARVVYHD